MAANKLVKRPATSTPGVKMLITAASVAATLGGWGLISSTERSPVITEATASAAAPVQAADKTVKIKLEPLPTLVPQITPQPQVITVNRPRAAASASQPAAAPQPAAANEIVLRDVSAPALPDRSAPAPVVNTGSSR